MSAPGLLLHIRNYASAGLLAALAGLISFPLLIHNLSVEDYGILGLITTSVSLFVSFGKLGIQHSVLRFYAEVKENNSKYSLLQLNSTAFILMFGLAIVTCIIWLLAGFFVFPMFLNYEGLSVLFVAAAGLLFLGPMNTPSTNFLRAQQRSGVVSIYQVMTRYLQLALIVALLLLFDLNPVYILLAIFVTELVGGAYVFRAYLPHLTIEPSAFSSDLSKVLFAYGFPLMVLESIGMVLRASDRYIIEAMLGTAQLGQYSASYNLVSYLELVVLLGVMQPMKPMYNQMWEREGPEATKIFLSKSFHLYLLIGFPVMTAFSLAAPHLLGFLANPEYQPGTVVIPYVTLSYYLEGAVVFLGAGLYLLKDTKSLMFWGLITAVLNIILNLIFVPSYGLLGASVVTVVSYIVFCAGITYNAFKVLSFPVSLLPLAKSLLLCALVYAIVSRFELSSEIGAMFLKGIVSTVLLCIGLYFIDGPLAAFVREKVAVYVPGFSK